MSQLLVGAGGWAYFQVPGSGSLQAYSKAFDFVELNSSYYQLPDYASVSDWRRKVPGGFQFAVRCPRIVTDHYGLELLPGSLGLLGRVEEVCRRLEATVMTVLIRKASPIKKDQLVPRLKEFLKAFSADATIVAVEFRDMKPSQEALDTMKDLGAVHCIDLSREEPAYQTEVLYSRLFGKGEDNIYEFDDGELREIVKKSSGPKFEKSILAFHGVRMYQDAGRVKSFIEKGYFPKITGGVGIDSIREVLSEDAKFPATRSSLLRDQGWKVFQDTEEVRKISYVLERLPEATYNSLSELLGELHSHQAFYSSK